jgi:hypothetical protein
MKLIALFFSELILVAVVIAATAVAIASAIEQIGH